MCFGWNIVDSLCHKLDFWIPMGLAVYVQDWGGGKDVLDGDFGE
jgi:hypothetical protein